MARAAPGKSAASVLSPKSEPTTRGEPSTEGKPTAVGNAGLRPGGQPTVGNAVRSSGNEVRAYIRSDMVLFSRFPLLACSLTFTK
jgi:hypothetical protein